MEVCLSQPSNGCTTMRSLTELVPSIKLVDTIMVNLALLWKSAEIVILTKLASFLLSTRFMELTNMVVSREKKTWSKKSSKEDLSLARLLYPIHLKNTRVESTAMRLVTLNLSMMFLLLDMEFKMERSIGLSVIPGVLTGEKMVSLKYAEVQTTSLLRAIVLGLHLKILGLQMRNTQQLKLNLIVLLMTRLFMLSPSQPIPWPKRRLSSLRKKHS